MTKSYISMLHHIVNKWHHEHLSETKGKNKEKLLMLLVNLGCYHKTKGYFQCVLMNQYGKLGEMVVGTNLETSIE